MARTRRAKRTAKTIGGFAATRGSRDVIEQARKDVARGLEDTDCRRPAGRAPGHCPRPRVRKKPRV